MQKLLYLFVGIVIALLFVGMALSSIKPIKRNENGNENTAKEEAVESTTGETVEVQIVGNEYSFTPSNLEINKGDKIILTFRNTGKIPHNLVIDELGISTKSVWRGQSDTVEFVATESGTLRYYCSIGNHAALGMTGSLEVK